MSLQLAAQHLASRGRGPDTTLVHMAPQEVAGLQALAKAHGGSLTLNPDTGLPEAGFLSSLLPMALGVALGPAGLGMSAAMAGLTTGAIGTLATGSLSKGLMAGLGAYGGAGLGAGLTGAGADAAAAAGMSGAGLNAAGAVAPEAVAANLGVQGASSAAGSQAAMLADQMAGFGPEGLASMQNAAAIPGTSYIAPQKFAETVAQSVPTTTQMPAFSREQLLADSALRGQQEYAQQGLFDRLGQGVSALGTEGGRAAALSGMGGGAQAAQYGLAALAPSMMAAMTPQQAQYKGSGPNPYRYRYEIDRPQLPYSGSSREAMQLTGRYVPYAAGGPIEAMSEQNAAKTLMANGGQMYAEGGETKADVAKGMTGASADAFRYLMGQTAQSPATIAAQQYGAQAAAAPTPSAAPAGPAMSSSEASVRSMFSNTAPLNTLTNMLADGFFGPQAAGAMREDPNQPYSFNFNPATGTYTQLAGGGIASLAMGGESHLGDYSDGGRLLKGPGDGVSDSIPATIADKRPARLADGEFVVPARIVSELGNGSTDAGARKLYAMMDRIQKARNKTTGKDRVAVDSRADKALPA